MRATANIVQLFDSFLEIANKTNAAHPVAPLHYHDYKKLFYCAPAAAGKKQRVRVAIRALSCCFVLLACCTRVQSQEFLRNGPWLNNQKAIRAA